MHFLFRTAAAALLSSACFSLVAQKKAESDPPLSPELQHLVEVNSLTLPGTAPWHLKAAYHHYSPENKTIEEGVFEEWWLSPASRKLVVQQDGRERTFVHDQGRTWS